MIRVAVRAHSIAPDEHGSIGAFPLVEAGVVNDPFPGQSERLRERERGRPSDM